MEELGEETLYALGGHVWRVEEALEGLGALFRISGDLGSLESREVHGIGELIVFIKNEATKVRRVLTERSLAQEFREFAPKDDPKRGTAKKDVSDGAPTSSSTNEKG